jgi:uncharacterized damage-inducible protein DinB
MKSSDLLADALGRIRETVLGVLDGITSEELSARLDSEANSIAWLVWHLTRVQDDHVAEVAGTEQIWTAAGWARRFALDLDDSEIGYGHSSEKVAAVKADPGELDGYNQAVYENTLQFVSQLSDPDLDKVVDERWDPPVTLGVRLISVIGDDLQHAGQAAFIKGILARRGR